MKTFIKKAFVFLLIAMMTSLTACAGNPQRTSPAPDAKEELHLAVILGNHRNAPRVNLGLVENQVNDACRSFGSVTLICDDGDPYSCFVDIPEQQAGLTKSKYASIADGQTKEILEAASKMAAKTSEVDTLKAIQLGARRLKAAEEDADGVKVISRMLILDSCLSTTGVLNFTNCTLDRVSPETVVDQLRELKEMPDMSMIDEAIVFTCGDTADEQVDLTGANKETLKNIWIAIFEAGGLSVDMKDGIPLSTEYETDALPEVSTVTVEQHSVDISSEEATEDALETGVVINFDETSIAFKPGTAELADPDTAKRSLEYVISFLDSHPDFKLLICGTTACWGGQQYCKDLSEKRARAVCNLLIESGVAENRLRAVGVGHSFSEFYLFDQTANGKLDESIAPLNRTVKIMGLYSNTASRVMNFLGIDAR